MLTKVLLEGIEHFRRQFHYQGPPSQGICMYILRALRYRMSVSLIYQRIIIAILPNINYSKLPMGPAPAPYLFIKAPKSWDLGTAYLLDCARGEGEALEPEDRCEESGPVFKCEVVLEDGRQGADPEAP